MKIIIRKDHYGDPVKNPIPRKIEYFDNNGGIYIESYDHNTMFEYSLGDLNLKKLYLDQENFINKTN